MVLDGPVVSRENGPTNAQSHARASVADEVPDIPTAFVRAGRFSCPWCEFETAHSSGLMTHITRMHAFELLSDESANYMLGLGKAVCRDCGFLRVRQGRQCGRCSSVRAPRPVRPGDAVQPVDFEMINSDSEADVSDPVETPGPSAMDAEPPEPADAGVGAGASSTRAGRRRGRGRQRRGPALRIPENLMATMRGISGSSALHIPASLRERMCAVAADCLEGMLAGEDDWGVFAEAFWKLVLYAIPARMSPLVELEQRLALIMGGR